MNINSELSRAELSVYGRWIFATAKHLKAFASGDPRVTYLSATTRSASDGDLLLRVRGLGAIPFSSFEAFALEAGIPKYEVRSTIQRLEERRLVSANYTQDGNIIAVQELVLTEEEVFRSIVQAFQALQPSEAERAFVPLLDLMSKLPLFEDEVIDKVCEYGFEEEDVRKALELQEALNLLRRETSSGWSNQLLYNEYLWGEKVGSLALVLEKLGPREKEWLLALVDEVRSDQGIALERLSSAPKHMIDMAAKIGIVDATSITTSTGETKHFAFSPHFYGYKPSRPGISLTDHADQIKLFVASMSFGAHHSVDFRLHSPIQFVEKLLAAGEAGDATPILRDYTLLERQGIILVEERSPGRGVMKLAKRDIVSNALEVMRHGSLSDFDLNSARDRTQFNQRGFGSPEMTRIELGERLGRTSKFDQDIVAALRETASQAKW